MKMPKYWIEFDLPALIALKIDYEATCEFIKDELPDVNWNSQLETRQYFLDEFNFLLYNQKISDYKELLDSIETLEYIENKEVARETLQGLIELKKLQSTLRNYINNILKHNEGGIYPLREVDGRLVMQNKQNLPYSPDILECVISKSEGIVLQ